MEWNGNVVMLVLAGMGLLLMGSAVFRPVKFLLQAAISLVTGFVLLVIANLFFQVLGIHIAINPFTVLLAGILQVPGVLLLAVLNYLVV